MKATLQVTWISNGEIVQKMSAEFPTIKVAREELVRFTLDNAYMLEDKASSLRDENKRWFHGRITSSYKNDHVLAEIIKKGQRQYFDED